MACQLCAAALYGFFTELRALGRETGPRLAVQYPTEHQQPVHYIQHRRTDCLM